MMIIISWVLFLISPVENYLIFFLITSSSQIKLKIFYIFFTWYLKRFLVQ